MPIVNYPFQAMIPGARRRPILPLRIRNPDPDSGQDFDTWGMIDTGADRIFIPSQIAEVINHNVVFGDPKSIITASGNTTAYEHTCEIQIFAMGQNGQVDYGNMRITIPPKHIWVLPDLDKVILGVDDFLADYILTIDYPNQMFSVRLP